MPAGDPIRFNEEYFGYIAGFPNGDIRLLDRAALPLLQRNAPLYEFAPYLLEKIALPSNFHLNTPPLVWLELTKRCNLTCPHCYIDGGEPRANELSTPALLRIVDDLANMGTWAIAVTGGEPTMHPDFSKIVNHIRDRGMLVGIATNGMFINEKLLASLPKTGVIVSVSLDNLHFPEHRWAKEFRSVEKAIKLCHEKGFRTNIMTNSNTRNTRVLEDLIRWARENRVSVRSVPFSPLGRGKNYPELENKTEDVNSMAEFWLEECLWEHEYHDEVGLCVGAIFNYGLSLAYMSQRCSSGRYLCYICSDGTVYPCTMCAGEKVFSPGSVRGMSINELWRSDWEIRNLNWSNFADTCASCVVNEPGVYCSGRCPATSHARHGKFFGCGCSDFEKVSTVVRTVLLQNTDLGKNDGTPIKFFRKPKNIEL